MNNSAEDAVVVTLKNMGVFPAVGTPLHTFALSEGRVVAEKFFYPGGYAVWVAGDGTLSLYDDEGHRLSSRGPDVVKRGAAA